MTLGLGIPLAALADDAPKPASSEPQKVESGKVLYAHHCSHCHGFNMMTAGTVTYDLRDFPMDKEERFFESVTNGKNARMPPWGDVLSQEEIGDIWAYVRTKGKS